MKTENKDKTTNRYIGLQSKPPNTQHNNAVAKLPN